MAAFAAVFREPTPPVAVVGAGAAGTVLARRLRAHGYPVAAVISRTAAKAAALARLVEAPTASSRLEDLPATARLVLLCVPDDVVADVAAALARVPHPWEQSLAAHAAGALPAAVLRPLAERGAHALAFHPLQTLRPDGGPEVLDGVFVGLEGEPPAVAAGIELATRLGLRYLVLQAEDKPRYHLAASMASNFLVTLVAAVQRVTTSLGLDRQTGLEVLEPLLQGTLENLARHGPEDALTGPVVRGDLETLRQHAAALRRHLPELVPLYAALATETVPLAVRSSRLDPERAEEVLAVVARLLAAPTTALRPVKEARSEAEPRAKPPRLEGTGAPPAR